MSFEASMEPYAQLVRSLLPRAASVNLFDNTGKLLWSSATSANPELFAIVLQAIAQLETDRDGAGQHCVLPDEGPAYLFWLRDAAGGVAAIAAVICNRPPSENDVLPFSFVHEQLRPAIELLRRDLLARASIDMLNESLHSRDKDLELLLSVTGSHPQIGGSDDLQTAQSHPIAGTPCEVPVPRKVTRAEVKGRGGPRVCRSPHRRRRHDAGAARRAAPPGAAAPPPSGCRGSSPRAARGCR